MTGDSTLSALACEGTVVDDQGRAVTIKDNNGNVLVQGTSEYTVTVEEFYDCGRCQRQRQRDVQRV